MPVAKLNKQQNITFFYTFLLWNVWMGVVYYETFIVSMEFTGGIKQNKRIEACDSSHALGSLGVCGHVRVQSHASPVKAWLWFSVNEAVGPLKIIKKYIFFSK